VNAQIDLSAYLQRIGWIGTTAPTLDCLRDLVGAHTAAIPFENLNPLLGIPVELSPEALDRKILRDGRGGYCFEQNQLFARALRAIGFPVVGLAARVVWNQAPDAITPRTHMLLRVPLDGGDHLVDVGFGGQTPTGVLRLAPEVDQATPHEPFRLLPRQGEWLAEARIGDAWRPLYRFDLQPQQDIDYELANHFVSTHPRSFFTFTLLAARAEPGRRYALRNREFAVHHTGGETEHRVLKDTRNICDVLESVFRLRLPDHPDLARRLDQLPF
jgi:N-hydroxyarylamine O-acetyltransferase